MLRRITSPGFVVAVCFGALLAASARTGGSAVRNAFDFEPLPASAACVPGGAGTFPNEEPFILPAGFIQTVVAREGDGGSIERFDMLTLNETGPHAGRYLYRSHETLEDGQVTVTDLATGVTSVLAERPDWNRLDGLVWTKWHTLLVGEEMRRGRTPSTSDPLVPQALAGLVYEVDPVSGASVPLAALGAKAHEGMRFDPEGNLYSISETAPTPVPPGGPGGYIFKFVPDQPGDLSSGQLYALKIVAPTGDRTGEAIWVPLDRTLVQVDADMAATQAGATGYGRPEDVEIATSTGNSRGGATIVYVAITNEHRVLRIDLREPGGGSDHATAFVSDYVRAGVNAPADFINPDNLALDASGNLFIAEDSTTPPGNDLWVAVPGAGNQLQADTTVRFASLTDCEAEVSGIYFDRRGQLFVNVLHVLGTVQPDLTMLIREARP